MKKTILILLFWLPLIAGAEEPGKFLHWMEEKPAGWYNATSFSILTTTGQFFNGMQTIVGYRFNSFIGAGMGIGVERFTGMPMYDEFTANLSHLPLFADIRYTILRSNISPFLAVQGGYKFLLNIPSTQYRKETEVIYPGIFWNVYYDNDTYRQGGMFVSAEAGVRIRTFGRFSLNTSFGYSLWSVSGERNHWLYQYLPDGQSGTKETIYYSSEKTTAITHTFMLRIGFGF